MKETTGITNGIRDRGNHEHRKRWRETGVTTPTARMERAGIFCFRESRANARKRCGRRKPAEGGKIDRRIRRVEGSARKRQQQQAQQQEAGAIERCMSEEMICGAVCHESDGESSGSKNRTRSGEREKPTESRTTGIPAPSSSSHHHHRQGGDRSQDVSMV